MKKALLPFVLALLFVSCQRHVEEKDLARINGYWEIDKVVLPDGEEKEYKINETIDFFELKNNTGFRKKVMPQFDGSYKTNSLAENVSIVRSNDAYFIEYKTSYGKWKEQIVEISDKALVLKNQQDLEYHYKKPIPFTLK
jgi:hypothetical protein